MKKILLLALCFLVISLALVSCGAPADLTDEYLEDGKWSGTLKAKDAVEEFGLADLGADESDAKTDIDMTLEFTGKNVVVTYDKEDVNALVSETLSADIADMFLDELEKIGIYESEEGYTVEDNEVSINGDVFKYEDGKLIGEDIPVDFEK